MNLSNSHGSSSTDPAFGGPANGENPGGGILRGPSVDTAGRLTGAADEEGGGPGGGGHAVAPKGMHAGGAIPVTLGGWTTHGAGGGSGSPPREPAAGGTGKAPKGEPAAAGAGAATEGGVGEPDAGAANPPKGLTDLASEGGTGIVRRGRHRTELTAKGAESTLRLSQVSTNDCGTCRKNVPIERTRKCYTGS